MNTKQDLLTAIDEAAWARSLLRVAINSLEAPHEIDQETTDGIVYLLGLVEEKAINIQRALQQEEVA